MEEVAEAAHVAAASEEAEEEASAALTEEAEEDLAQGRICITADFGREDITATAAVA